MVTDFISQLSEMQNEEWISKPESSRVSDNGSGQQVARCLCDEPKQFFNDSRSLDRVVEHLKQQEGKSIQISEVIHILRITKVQQCIDNYNRKFCVNWL